MPRKATRVAPAEQVGPREVALDYYDDDWVEIYPEQCLFVDTARALLDTASSLGYDPARAVHAVADGFRVPQLVAATVVFPTEPSPQHQRVVRTPQSAVEKGAIPDAPTATDAGS